MDPDKNPTPSDQPAQTVTITPRQPTALPANDTPNWSELLATMPDYTIELPHHKTGYNKDFLRQWVSDNDDRSFDGEEFLGASKDLLAGLTQMDGNRTSRALGAFGAGFEDGIIGEVAELIDDNLVDPDSRVPPPNPMQPMFDMSNETTRHYIWGADPFTPRGLSFNFSEVEVPLLGELPEFKFRAGIDLRDKPYIDERGQLRDKRDVAYGASIIFK